jgi:hypothetical protein
VLAGITNDGQFNQQLRDPLIAMDKMIDFVLEHEGETIDPQVALDMHLAAIRNVGDYIEEAQLIMVGDYDDRSMLSTSVEINMGSFWIRCTVINKNASICWPTIQLYQKGLNCILNHEDNCRMTASEKSMEWLTQHGSELGEIPDLSIVAFQGTVHFLQVNLENGDAFECRFRKTQPILFESCERVD